MSDYSDAVYVFDLDGVITDPETTTIDARVVDHISDMLAAGAHVAVNTGRSYEWVKTNLVSTFERRNSPEAFERLIIVCEKGGESLLWRDGKLTEQPSRFALQQQAYDITKRIFEEHKTAFSSMFWDDTKRTMATVEKKPEADLDDFKRQQQHFIGLLREELRAFDVKIMPTVSATDVELPEAGKHAGAELIYEWVAKNTDVTHDTFTCFGDSPGDYEMARYFAQTGAKTTFVFVGKPDLTFEEDERAKTIRPTAHYAAGTREYFGLEDK